MSLALLTHTARAVLGGTLVNQGSLLEVTHVRPESHLMIVSPSTIPLEMFVTAPNPIQAHSSRARLRVIDDLLIGLERSFVQPAFRPPVCTRELGNGICNLSMCSVWSRHSVRCLPCRAPEAGLVLVDSAQVWCIRKERLESVSQPGAHLRLLQYSAGDELHMQHVRVALRGHMAFRLTCMADTHYAGLAQG